MNEPNLLHMMTRERAALLLKCHEHVKWNYIRLDTVGDHARKIRLYNFDQLCKFQHDREVEFMRQAAWMVDHIEKQPNQGAEWLERRADEAAQHVLHQERADPAFVAAYDAMIRADIAANNVVRKI